MKKIGWILWLCACSFAWAEGSIEAGKQKIGTCVACHGENGISSNPIWPSLAGQHYQYLLKQLQDYKSQARKNASMSGMVAALSEQDMQDLSAYYASLPPPEGASDKQFIDRGEALYRGGDFSTHVSACIACHGPRGIGNGQANFPMLSGQHAQYTMDQLQYFKTGERNNDLNAIMRDISKRMSKEDIEAVANYVQGLH